MWRRIPFVPMLFGACAALALLTVLAIREPQANDWHVYVAGAALGAAYVLLFHYVFSLVPARSHSLPAAIGCGCAYAAAGYWFLLIIAILIAVVTQSGVRITGMQHGGVSLLAFAGLGLLGGLMLALYRRTEAERQESALRAQAADFARSQLELARDLQQRLLPPPTLEGQGFRVVARNVPAAYVAGDFFDFVPLAGGGLMIVIADVAGKGIAAGLIMASVKAMIPLIVAEERHAGALLGRLNERLVGQLPQREFVALALAIFDPSRGSLSLANAALPDPLLLPRNGEVRPIVVAGPRYPIGVRKNLSYESVTVKLSPGDRILLFTDGLAEAIVGGEPLGYERLTAEVRQAASVEVLFARLEQIGATHEDDWTAVMLEILQPQASGTTSSAAAVRFDRDVT